MSWSDVLGAAAERMVSAPPYAVVDALERALRAVDPSITCVVYLADYQMEELRPVDPAAGPPIRLEGTELGRAFVAERTIQLSDRPSALVTPITVRGDRLGVLVVRGEPSSVAGDGDGDGDPLPLGVLARLGVLVGQALLVAGHVTDAYRIARRSGPLTLAAEMQWDKLPGRSLDVGFARIAGQLEPAHHVVGDAYDWVCDDTGLSAVLVDGSGYGTHAAGNTAFAISAIRNARREGADLTGAARLADQALHARFGGSLFASAVLLELDPRTGDLQIVTAGAGLVVLADRHRSHRLTLQVQPPLGAEEDHPYRADTVRLRPGDRLLVASDGLTDAQIGSAAFGDRLDRLVQSYRLLGAAEVVRAVIRDLKTFHAGNPLADDAVILCLDLATTDARLS